MNQGIYKYIAKCGLYRREKAKTQMYPLQMTDILEHPFVKIPIDHIIDLNVSTSGNQHILTIIKHLAGWPEAFPIPDKNANTIVHVLINNYLLVYKWPRYILSDNTTELKISLKTMYSNNVASIVSYLPLTIPRVMASLK